VKLRNKTADIVKGIAILLIIFGHSICAHTINYNDNLVFNIIYSFHVPLFFAVAGYFAYGKNDNRWMRKKSFMVLVPFLVFSVLNYIVGYIPGYPGLVWHNLGISLYIEYLFLYNWGLWFLVVLWWCYFWIWNIDNSNSVGQFCGNSDSRSFCFEPYVSRRTFVFWLGAILRIGIMLVIPALFHFGLMFQNVPYKNIFGVSQVPYYFWFFFGGYLVAKNKDFLSKYMYRILGLGAISYMAIMITTNFDGGWTSTEFSSPMVVVACFGWWTLIRITLQAVFGILAIILISKILSRFRIFDVIAYIGTMTLALFILSGRFLSWGFGGGWIDIVTGSIIAFIISYLIIQLVKRIKWADIILFGNYKRTRNE